MNFSIDNRIKEYKKWLIKLLESKSFYIQELHDDFLRKNYSSHNLKGVYIIFGEDNQIFYVGQTKTTTILHRIGDQHVGGQSGSDLREMLGRPPIQKVLGLTCKYLEVQDGRDRTFFEHFVISILKPTLNK